MKLIRKVALCLVLTCCLPAILIGYEMRRQYLDGDLATQVDVLGSVDLAHPAGPDFLEYAEV